MNNELYHHGVKGQKWGVRRYQDKSGRLTPAGKKHRVMSEKKAKRTINEINEKQRQKDIYDIADQNEKNLTKKQRIAKNAALVGAGAAYIGVASAMGAGVNGKKGAGMMAAAAAGQVGILGLTAVAATKYADKKFKKTDAEIRKLCNKLEDNGYKVSEQKTYMSYTLNGQYLGTTNTKRYNLSGDTKPYREDYQYNVQYMYV